MGTNQRNGFTPGGLFQKVRLPNSRMKLRWPRPETHGRVDVDKLEENFRQILDQLDENSAYLNRTDWGAGEGTRWGTIVVAAANSSAASRAKADYVCTGASDQTMLELAIGVLLVENPAGGKLVLLEGEFVLSGDIDVVLGGGQELVIEGMSSGNAKGSVSAAATVINGSAIGVANAINALNGALTVKNVLVNAGTGGNAIFAFNTKLNVDQCALYGNGGVIVFTSAGGSADGSRVTNSTIITSGGSGVVFFSADHALVANTEIVITGATGGTGTWGISSAHSLGIGSEFIAIGNDITVDSNSGGIAAGDNGTTECLIIGNVVRGAGVQSGILAAAFAAVVADNIVRNCTKGIFSPGGNNTIVGNEIFHSGTPTSAIESTGDNNLIMANKCAVASGSSILVSGTNSSVVYNEGAAGGPATVTDTGTGTKREAAWLLTGQVADLNARVGVRVDSTGSTFLRRRINLIPGTNVSITHSDDNTNEEVDVTISVSGTAAIGVEDNGSLVGSRGAINLIEGTNVALTFNDDPGNDRVDVTINSTGGGSGGYTVPQLEVGGGFADLWLDASIAASLHYSGGVNVSAWDDETGEGNGFAAGGGTIVTGSVTQNGLDGVTLSSSGYLSGATRLELGTFPRTFIVVAKSPASYATPASIISGGSNSLQFRLDQTTGNLQLVATAVASIGTGPAVAADTPFIAVAQVKAGYFRFQLDGGAFTTGTHARTLSASGANIGRNAASNNEFFAGTIFEVVMLPMWLNDFHLDILVSFLQAKWAI